MEWTRRDILWMTSVSAAGLTVTGCDELIEAIQNRPIRRNIATLPTNDPIVEAYRDAVDQMRNLPASDPRNWNAQATIHQDFCPHGNWLFLPWHRSYLMRFERICQELIGDSNWGLPYWNWCTSPSIPDHFWGAGNVLTHPRTATATSTVSSANVGGTVVDNMLNETVFEQFASGSIPLAASQRQRNFSGPLEGQAHDYIHVFTGGDMVTFMSPLDPLFWCHHNMVEACWVEWQFGRGNVNTNDSNWLDREFTEFVDDQGNAIVEEVDIGLLYPVLSYQFDAFDIGFGPSDDRIDQQNPQDDEGQQEQEDEAGRTGDTSLDFVAEYASSAAAVATAESPAVLRIPVSLSDSILPAVQQGARVLLEVAVGEILQWEDIHGRVFVNNPQAGRATSTDDPGYVASFGFFLHHPPNAADPVTLRFDATAALQATSTVDPDAVTITVVVDVATGRTLVDAELNALEAVLRVSGTAERTGG